MSIELLLEAKRPIRLRPLFPRIRAVLSQILGEVLIPDLTLEALENEGRVGPTTDELVDENSPFFLISILGEPETVALKLTGEHFRVEMAAQRTNLEYALGAAIAVVLSRELGAEIEDDWHFFSERALSTEEFLNALRLTGPFTDYREAAEGLEGKIDLAGRS